MPLSSYFYFKLLIPIVNNSIKYKTSFQSSLAMCYINAAYFPSSSPASKNRTCDAGSAHCAGSHLHTYHVQSPTGTDSFCRRLFSVSPFLLAHTAYFVKWSLMFLKKWRSATGMRRLQIILFLFRILQLPQETSVGYTEELCYKHLEG